MILMATGCGQPSGTPTANSSGPAAGMSKTIATTGGEEDVSGAPIVVSQFLDAVRRGGETGGANQLLTQQAQAVLARLGQSVQPLGTPDAVFEVTRSEAIPGTPGAALVHSFWTEADANGKKQAYEVVWALVKETAGWRISGLAMDLEPGKEPFILDFENSTQMASQFNQSDETVAMAPSGRDSLSQPPTNDATQTR